MKAHTVVANSKSLILLQLPCSVLLNHAWRLVGNAFLFPFRSNFARVGKPFSALSSYATMSDNANAPLSAHITVIGAGISGLLAAQSFADNGIKTTILEKARGVGGRMATRRRDAATFDHGAQFFTVRSVTFQRLVERWQEARLVTPWFTHFPTETKQAGYTRYRAVPTMTGIAKAIAKDLDVRNQHKVEQMHFEDGVWTLTCENGEVVTSNFLLITAPVPQAMELVDRSNIQLREDKRNALNAIRYNPCLTVLADLAEPSQMPEQGILKVNSGPIQMIVDCQKKGISEAPAAIIHSTADYATTHWESADDVRVPPLVDAAKSALGVEVTGTSTHRWKYAEVLNPLGSLSFISRRHNLGLCGDGFSGANIEAAALSGLTAAEHLLDFL